MFITANFSSFSFSLAQCVLSVTLRSQNSHSCTLPRLKSIHQTSSHAVQYSCYIHVFRAAFMLDAQMSASSDICDIWNLVTWIKDIMGVHQGYLPPKDRFATFVHSEVKYHQTMLETWWSCCHCSTLMQTWVVSPATKAPGLASGLSGLNVSGAHSHINQSACSMTWCTNPH